MSKQTACASNASIAWPLLYGSNNGTIALLTTSRLVFAFSNKVMNQNFIQAALKPIGNNSTANNGHLYRSLGEAIHVAKNLSNQSNSQTSEDPLNSRKFMLLGDPSLQLALPELPIQVNQIKEKNSGIIILLTDSLITLHTYELIGQINQSNGNLASDYNGTVSVQFYDHPQTVFTLNNSLESPRTGFSTKKTIIFNVKATVTNEVFSIDFKVPRDISFGPNKANIRLNAQRSDSTNTQPAAGAIPMKIADNTGNNSRDTTGPQITLYLNDTSFKKGGLTHENPVLIAKLFNTSGINATGNGIGHEIVLVLNGEERNSIVLNSFSAMKSTNTREGLCVTNCLNFHLENTESN